MAAASPPAAAPPATAPPSPAQPSDAPPAAAQPAAAQRAAAQPDVAQPAAAQPAATNPAAVFQIPKTASLLLDFFMKSESKVSLMHESLWHFCRNRVVLHAQECQLKLYRQVITYQDIHDMVENLCINKSKDIGKELGISVRKMIIIVAEVASSLERIAEVPVSDWMAIGDAIAYMLQGTNPPQPLSFAKFMPRIRDFHHLKMLGAGGFGASPVEDGWFPGELLQGGRLRTPMPDFNPVIRNHQKSETPAERIRTLPGVSDNDVVLLNETPWAAKAKVSRSAGLRSFYVGTENNEVLGPNHRHLLATKESVGSPDEEDFAKHHIPFQGEVSTTTAASPTQAPQPSPQPLRRSRRQMRPPERLVYDQQFQQKSQRH